MLNVIKQADQAKSSSNNRRTASNSSALTIQSNTSELAVGLTNASKLLMTLASGIQQPSAAIKKPQVNNQAWMMDSPQDEAEMSDSDLESLVKSIFVKLDIDGDGLISWWEWKSVLTASLCASSSSNSSQQLQTSNSSQDMIRQIISPLDPLLISFFAACSALSVAPSSSTSSSSITTKTIRFPEELNIKEIYANIMKLQQKFGVGFIDFGNNNFQRVLSQQGLLPVLDDEDANPGKGSSKVASRLNQMVKSLRYSNNILSKRLEDALLISQQLQVASENINNDQNATLDSKLKQYEDNLHTIKLQEKVETLDKQSLDLLQQYENAKQRGDKLAIALLEQNASLKLAKQSRFLQMQQRRQQHDLIVQEIETRADELKKKRVEKKRRFYALVKLKMFFLTIVKPRLLEKAKKQAAMKISTHASKARMKKKHQEKRSNLVHAAITIQRYYRGYHTRKELQAKKLSIVKLQSLYRSHQANLKVQDRRVKKQKIDTLLKKNLANVVGKVWRDYQFVRLNKAAVKLSKVFRKKGLENRFDRRKKAMEEEKALKQKEAEARDVITRSMMMHNDKQKAKKLRKHAVHVKVFEDERLKLYAMNHKPTDIQAVSTVCTEANQSNNATVAAASNNGSGSPRDLSTASGKLRYWVGDMAHPGGALVKNTPGIQLSHLGRVELVNTNTRIMEIFYLPEYHMNQGLQDIPPFQKKLLPFDHPGLIWFSKTEPPQEVIVEEKIEDVVVVHEPIVDLEIPPPTESTPPEDPILYSPTDSEAEDDDDSPLVEDFEEPNENDEENAQYIPELSHAYRGYCVNYSLDGEEIESVFGKVVQVDLENNLIALDFRVTNTKDAAEMPAHAKPSAIWHDKDNHPPRVILPSTTDANQKLGVSSQEFLNHCQPGDYIWAHYEHGYLTWFNKQGKLLMSREKSTTRNNSPNKKQPGSGKKNKENKKKDKTPNKSNDKPFGSPSKHKVPFGSKETDPKSAVAKLASGASSGTASPGRPPLGNDAQNKKSVSNAMENKEESGKEPLKTSSGSAKHPFPSIKESTGSESPGKISATFSSEESSFKSSPNMSPGKKMKRQGTAMMALQFSSDEDDDDEEDELVVMRK